MNGNITKEGIEKDFQWMQRVRINVILPISPSVADPFQKMVLVDAITSQEVEGPRFHRDVAVLAYRTPKALLRDSKPVSIATSTPASGCHSTTEWGGHKPTALPIAKTRPAWVLYDYGGRRHFCAVSLARPLMFSVTTWTRLGREPSIESRPI